MGNLFVFIWAVFVLSVVFLLVWRSCSKNPQYEFQQYGTVDIPYVILDMQGHKLNMIVDSGCGTSILNKPAIDEFGIDYKSLNKGYSITALTEEKMDINCILVEYTLHGETVVDEFSVYDTPDFGNFMHMYGIEIHGLLGTNFFDAHSCTLDFKNHCLTFS